MSVDYFILDIRHALLDEELSLQLEGAFLRMLENLFHLLVSHSKSTSVAVSVITSTGVSVVLSVQKVSPSLLSSIDSLRQRISSLREHSSEVNEVSSQPLAGVMRHHLSAARQLHYHRCSIIAASTVAQPLPSQIVSPFDEVETSLIVLLLNPQILVSTNTVPQLHVQLLRCADLAALQMAFQICTAEYFMHDFSEVITLTFPHDVRLECQLRSAVIPLQSLQNRCIEGITSLNILQRVSLMSVDQQFIIGDAYTLNSPFPDVGLHLVESKSGLIAQCSSTSHRLLQMSSFYLIMPCENSHFSSLQLREVVSFDRTAIVEFKSLEQTCDTPSDASNAMKSMDITLFDITSLRTTARCLKGNIPVVADKKSHSEGVAPRHSAVRLLHQFL